MASLEINIDCEWYSHEANLDLCEICGEIMVTNSNTLYLFLNNKLNDKPLITVCNSCYIALKDNK